MTSPGQIQSGIWANTFTKHTVSVTGTTKNAATFTNTPKS